MQIIYAVLKPDTGLRCQQFAGDFRNCRTGTFYSFLPHNFLPHSFLPHSFLPHSFLPFPHVDDLNAALSNFESHFLNLNFLISLPRFWELHTYLRMCIGIIWKFK